MELGLVEDAPTTTEECRCCTIPSDTISFLCVLAVAVWRGVQGFLATWCRHCHSPPDLDVLAQYSTLDRRRGYDTVAICGLQWQCRVQGIEAVAGSRQSEG